MFWTLITERSTYRFVVLGLVIAMGFNGSPATAHPKGLYSTEQEALERAQQIGCDNVHRNNGRWMPCRDERELHRQLRKN